MFTRIVVVAVVGLTAPAFAGQAAAAEGRDAREREARKACFTGNVDRGVEILVDLYGETGHPNYIYNQARCFERNGKYDQALLSYEDYLRKARDVGTAERAEVEKAITELRAKVGSAARPGAATTPPSSVAGGEPPPGLLTPELDKAGPLAPGLVGTQEDRPSVDAAWPWQRTAGVIALVAAGGGLALGVAGHVLREGRAGDFNVACYYTGGQAIAFADPGVDCRGRYEAVHSAETMMLIGYVGAGVLAGAGAALLVFAPHAVADTGAAHAALARCAPMAGTTNGVVCGGSF